MIAPREYKTQTYVLSNNAVLEIEYCVDEDTPFVAYHCIRLDKSSVKLKFFREEIEPFWVQRGDIYEITEDTIFVVMQLEFKKATGVLARGVMGERGRLKEFLKNANKPRNWSRFNLEDLSKFELTTE